MKTIFGIPENRINQLRKDKERGVLLLANLTQDERDALHYETSEENFAYWKAERKKAKEAGQKTGSEERFRRCDYGCRMMLLELTPYTSDEDTLHDDVLGSLLAEVDDLPAEHRTHKKCTQKNQWE